MKNCGEIVADKSPGVAQVGKKGTSRSTPAGFTAKISQTCVLVLVGKFHRPSGTESKHMLGPAANDLAT